MVQKSQTTTGWMYKNPVNNGRFTNLNWSVKTGFRTKHQQYHHHLSTEETRLIRRKGLIQSSSFLVLRSTKNHEKSLRRVSSRSNLSGFGLKMLRFFGRRGMVIEKVRMLGKHRHISRPQQFHILFPHPATLLRRNTSGRTSFSRKLVELRSCLSCQVQNECWVPNRHAHLMNNRVPIHFSSKGSKRTIIHHNCISTFELTMGSKGGVGELNTS